MTLRTISFGGGVQSTSLVALAATHDPRFEEIMGGPVDVALFANVGDDSEHPAALSWVRDVVTPWAAERGLPVHELRRKLQDGSVETLLGRMIDGPRRLPIPVRAPNGAPYSRSCTKDFKIDVLAKWLKANGASDDDPATVAVGISTDEIHRVNNRRCSAWESLVYPLINLGMDRSACQQLNVETFGRPAPKSSCWFCPFHSSLTWAEMRRDEPELFARSQELEDMLIRNRSELDRHPVYLTRFGKRLSDAIFEAGPTIWSLVDDGDGDESGQCDEGACFT